MVPIWVAVKPSPRITSRTVAGVAASGPAQAVTVADDMLKLTLAAATPGVASRVFSMLAAHDAQLMPLTKNSMVSR